MRSLLRKLLAACAALSLVFFWSCERHEVGELPDHKQHGKPGEGHHGKGADHGKDRKKDDDGHGHAAGGKHDHHGKSQNADDKPNPADGGAQQEGTGTPPPRDDAHAGHSPAAAPAGTPAQFFASPTPH